MFLQETAKEMMALQRREVIPIACDVRDIDQGRGVCGKQQNAALGEMPCV